MKIAIIDSGINFSDYFNKCKSIDGITISVVDNEVIYGKTYNDDCGHGTAVLDIFNKNIQGIYDLFIVKIFDGNFTTDSEKLFLALNYIDSFVNCNMILVSSGVRISCKKTEKLINKLIKRNIIIISAFDNNGAVSYPAGYEKVIGVESSHKYRKIEQFMYNTNSIVNIIGSDSSFRVKWLNGKSNIVRGNSFITAYFAAVIANYILTENSCSYEECLKYLQRIASDIKKYNRVKKIRPSKHFLHSGQRAIVFPFNKEIQSIAKFEKELSIIVEGYYDTKYSGHVGEKISDIYKYIDNDKIIHNYEDIDWKNSFDILILGHTGELCNITNVDYTDYFIKKCKENGKKIYCFDDISSRLSEMMSKEQYFIPQITSSMFTKSTFGKQYLINLPVIGIFGTSSKQGKYTLQLMLRRELCNMGYKVAQLGTEPSGYLFSFDYVYPMGYNSTVYVKGEEAITTVNYIMHKCEQTGKDIIIVGSQSGTVPMVNYNLKYFPMKGIEFILGTQPDYVVLCVNMHDDINYIDRTIKYIESICDCKVISLCVYPEKIIISDNKGYKKNTISDDEKNEYTNVLLKTFKMNVFWLNDNEGVKLLAKNIIDDLK